MSDLIIPLDLRVGRGPAIRNALIKAHAANDGVMNIVEVGTIRDLKPQAYLGDGYSSLLWAWYAQSHPETRVHLVDVDREALGRCSQVFAQEIGGTPINVMLNCTTGENYLELFGEPTIELLYLDGSDDPGQMNEQFNIAERRHLLRRGAFLLLDDIGDQRPDGTWPGKGAILVPRLLEDDRWVLDTDDRGTKQLLFRRVK